MFTKLGKLNDARLTGYGYTYSYKDMFIHAVRTRESQKSYRWTLYLDHSNNKRLYKVTHGERSIKEGLEIVQRYMKEINLCG